MKVVPAVLLSLLFAASAAASVVLRADLETLARRSDLAVEGVVRETTVFHDRALGRIWTRHRVAVDSTLVGADVEEVLVHVPGGRVGDVEQDIHGTARLIDGARVVLFLWKDDGGRARVLGQAQGCFLVERDAATGATLAHNDTTGLTLVDRGMRPVAARAARLRLDDLRRRVRSTRRAMEEEQRLRKEALARRMEARRRQAELNEERTRGRPGGAE